MVEAKNADVEIWRKVPGDYYSPSIHITEHDDIGINVGGTVIVAPVEWWFAAGEAARGMEEWDDEPPRSARLSRHFNQIVKRIKDIRWPR